jgi:hypothetical protein
MVIHLMNQPQHVENRGAQFSLRVLVVSLVAGLGLFSQFGCGGGGGDGSPSGSVGTGPGTAAVSWEAPTTNEDGSALDGDLAGYKLYYATASPIDKINAPSINVGNTTSYTLSGLNVGTYYFSATAYDTSGNESALSGEVSKVIS